MKKALLGVAVVLGLGLAGISNAQAQGLTLGIQGGYNYAQLSDLPTDIDEVGDKGSFVVGAFVDIQFSKLLFIGVEGMYLENKAELTDTTATTFGIKQAYVEIPAYLGVRLLSGMFQPVLYAGASIAFETSCDLSVGTLTGSCSEEFDTKSSIWSAVFGGGLDIALGAIRLNGDIRYNLGLTEVRDVEGETTKWNSWMALVGIGFGIG